MSPNCLQIRVHDRRNGLTHEHCFTAPVIRIGRDPTCELQLPDPFVSAQHALLEADEHGVRLRDLGGTNGLRVAGRRLSPHATVPISGHLRISLGPFDLEILHTPDRDRRTTRGVVDPTGPAPQSDLHAHLRTLRTLHTPFIAARRAFETALADTLHTLQTHGDILTARRILAEFPPEDHEHLVLPDLSQRPAELPEHELSQRPSSPELPARDLPHKPSSQRAHLAPVPVSARLTTPAPALQLVATIARELLPTTRPPSSLDEARDFLARLVDTLRSFATGLTALQQLRRLQLTELGLDITSDRNPLLAVTCTDEFLPALLARDDRRAELLDCFAVLTSHAHAHVTGALAATRHLASELAPPAVIRHAAPALLRTRARWRSYLARYAAILGDERSPGSLRTRFRTAYLDALHRDA